MADGRWIIGPGITWAYAARVLVGLFRHGERIRRGALCGLAGVLVVVVVCGSEVGAAAATGPQFEGGCHAKTIVDYSQPLREMRPIRRLPRSGKGLPRSGTLPFAPRGVKVHVVGEGALAGSHAIGFSLDPAQLETGSFSLRHVEAELMLVTRSGRAVRTLTSRHWGPRRYDNGAAPKLSFEVGRPAFYKVEVTFSDTGGHRLGRYAEYFRVLNRSVSVAVTLVRQDLHPGDIVESTVENRGTTWLEFGEEFSIERFADGAWRQTALAPGGFITVGYAISGGSGYVCRNLRLPTDVAAGHYRFIKPVSVAGGGDRRLSADFHISE